MMGVPVEQIKRYFNKGVSFINVLDKSVGKYRKFDGISPGGGGGHSLIWPIRGRAAG